jgi:hypothetical protein
MKDNSTFSPAFLTPLTDEQIWPTLSFEYLFEELRKKEALYISVEQTITGTQLRIEPESYFFNTDTSMVITGIPNDLTLKTYNERLISIFKVGKEDIELVTSVITVPFPERRFFTWQEDVFNSCSCESDKDNELDLISKIIIDANQIWDALTGADYGDRLFLINVDFKLAFSTAVVTLNGDTGFYYYNDTLRNPNVLERWQTFIANCLYDLRLAGVQFELECNPLIDGFACVQFGNGGNTPWSQKGYASYADPQDVIVDTDNGYPTNISQPTDFFPGGSFGYKIPITGYYIFESQAYWKLTVPSNVDNATVQISIVAFEDATAAVEIYRKDEQYVYLNTGSLVNKILYILTDFVQLPGGAVVVVELSSNVTNSSPVFVAQDFQREFFRFSDAINCFDLPRNELSYPYLYEFKQKLCDAEFQSMNESKGSKVELNGIDCWIKSVEQGINGEALITLLSNDIICCNA